MAETTKIGWADATFNPWIGCQEVSPACDNCYARAWDERFRGGHWGPHAVRKRTHPVNWQKPLQWESRHKTFEAEHGRRRRVFCASLADIFDDAVPPEWRTDLWELIEKTPHLDWMLLTKRPQNIQSMIPDYYWVHNQRNVWLGATVEDQSVANRRIRNLLRTPAPVHFISAEPLLSALTIEDWQFDHGINWIISGGESGAHARPSNPHWFMSLRDQCEAVDCAYFFKQWGTWAPRKEIPLKRALSEGQNLRVVDTMDVTNWADTGLWAMNNQYSVRDPGAPPLLNGKLHQEFPGGKYD